MMWRTVGFPSSTYSRTTMVASTATRTRTPLNYHLLIARPTPTTRLSTCTTMSIESEPDVNDTPDMVGMGRVATILRRSVCSIAVKDGVCPRTWWHLRQERNDTIEN